MHFLINVKNQQMILANSPVVQIDHGYGLLIATMHHF